MSRLLDALRNLQEPIGGSEPASPLKVTPRLAASIRKALVRSETEQATTRVTASKVPIRVAGAPPQPDRDSSQAPPLQLESPPQVAEPVCEPLRPDPVTLVESIQASISDVQEVPVQQRMEAPQEVQPATPIVAASPIPLSEQPSRARPLPTPAELEWSALLSDQRLSLPYHQLRAAVEREVAGNRTPVVAIVGLDNDHETSRVAAALATLLASERSRRVLLVEANPERELTQQFRVSHASGLSESLAGRAARPSVIVATSHDWLDLLPFGQATTDQAQLLPQALAVEIAQLRTSLGTTIIDAGALSSSWALAASQAADAVYLTIRLGETSAERAALLVQRFRVAGGKLTGCIAIGAK